MRRQHYTPLSTSSLLVLVLLATSVLTAHALPYFRVEDGGKQCFLEEVPQDTLIVGKYKLLDWLLMNSNTPGMSATTMTIEVRDPRQNIILNHEMSQEGQFGFTSSMAGEHVICCLVSATSSYYGGSKTYRVQLVLDYGEEAIDYAALAKTEHLSAIEVEVRKLNDKLRGISKEQDYHKAREIAWRDHSENVNADVMWWSIAQTVVLVGAGLAQLFLLTKFFKSKKLA